MVCHINSSLCTVLDQHCSKLILLQREDLRCLVVTQTLMLKNCYTTVELWEAGNQPCLSSILIIFLQSVDTPRNSTEQVHLLCTKPNHLRLFMFSGPRQQNNETMRQKKRKKRKTAAFEKKKWGGGVLLGISWGFILNEAQWLNFPSLVPWKTDI